MPSNPIVGVVLAGGRSQRMGGVEKASVLLDDVPLIERAIANLAPQVSRLILNANGDQTRFAALGLPVVCDETQDFSGPLAGVLAGLRWAVREEPGSAAVMSVSVDAPFVPRDLVARLSGALADNERAHVAVARSRGQSQYVVALWRTTCATAISDALARGDSKVQRIVASLDPVFVDFADIEVGGAQFDPFFNINTPVDLAVAQLAVAGRHPGAKFADKPVVFGVAGWKNSGKTTVVEKLVRDFSQRGYRVSTVKHSHHDIDGEADGTDSARHRAAGAHQVVIVSPRRWAVTEGRHDIAWRQDAEVPLERVLAALAPADLVIVEGYKRADIPKIEVRRSAQGDGAPLAPIDRAVLAVAADHDVGDNAVPAFSLDDVGGLSHLVLALAGLPERAAS